MLGISLNESLLMLSFDNISLFFGIILFSIYMVGTRSRTVLLVETEKDELFFFTISLGLAFGSDLFRIEGFGSYFNIVIAILVYLVLIRTDLKSRLNSMLFVLSTMIGSYTYEYYSLIVLCGVYMFFMTRYPIYLPVKKKEYVPLLNSFTYFGIILFIIMFLTSILQNFYILLIAIPIGILMLRDFVNDLGHEKEYCLSRAIVGLFAVVGAGMLGI
jgi:hypothetical protein